MRWIVGTDRGLVDAEGGDRFGGRRVTAAAWDGDGWLVLADEHEVVRVRGDEVDGLGTVPDGVGRCVLPVGGGALVGTSQARLASVHPDRGSTMVSSFDAADGRDGWYTPWGGPPDTRSLTTSADGRLFANVHVGGILRGDAPDASWEPTIDVDSDVHQVLADPRDATHVVAATALGLAETDDAGDTWTFVTDGLHASYARAVALDGERLFLSASTGPRGGRAALYRRDAPGDRFVRCDGGLPEWFGGNIDTHRLAARGGTVVFATEDGRVFVSEDAGGSWIEALGGLGRISCVGLESPG